MVKACVSTGENMDNKNMDNGKMVLKRDEKGLALVSEHQILRGDFTRMLRRVKQNNISQELLVKTAKIKGSESNLTAIDATAGLGEDSLLLAAAGFHVKMYERNPIIFELLQDALDRATQIPELEKIVARMKAFNQCSIEAMKDLGTRLEDEETKEKDKPTMAPDIILLDPMFPERQKSALVKKKLQMIQKLEIPCDDEGAMFFAAIGARPKKLIIKRPPKGPFLAGIKPDYSNKGKAVRYDCFVSPYDRIHKLK